MNNENDTRNLGLGKRLQILRESLGFPQQKGFAEEYGLNAASWGRWESEINPPKLKDIISLKEKIDFDIDWLLTGQGQMFDAVGLGETDNAMEQRYVDLAEETGEIDVSHIEGGVISIPKYVVTASAGNGDIAISQEVADWFTVSREWINRYVPSTSQVGILEARGDSMLNTIADGDLLLLNLTTEPHWMENGGIFVFSKDDSVFVKRLQATVSGQLHIISDNKDIYPSETMGLEEAMQTLTIHAKVVCTIGPVRAFRAS